MTWSRFLSLFSKKDNTPVKLADAPLRLEVKKKTGSKLATDLLLEKKQEAYCQKEALRQKLIADIKIIPNDFIDEMITQDLFVEPVLTPCGHWGDGPALKKWLVEHPGCPVCREPINKLIYDVELKKIVVEFKQYQESTLKKISALTLSEMKQVENDHKTTLSTWLKQFSDVKQRLVEQSKRNQVKKIMGDLPRQLSCSHPGITVCGHVEDSALGWCYTCGTRLDPFPVLESPELSNQIQSFQQERNLILSELKQEKCPEDLVRRAIKYKEKETKQLLQDVQATKVNYMTLFIPDRKNALKIDVTNREHLYYWHQKTNHCWHGYGGVKVILDKETFRIPTRIHQMMLAAQGHFDDCETFMQTLNQARSHKPTWFNQLFSCAMTRSAETTEVYETDYLQRLRL